MPVAAAVRPSSTRAETSALRRLPKEAQDKFEHLRRTELRARSTINGLREEIIRITESRHDAETQLDRFDRAHAGEYSTDGMGKQIPLQHPEREHIVETIKSCRAEHARLLAEQEASEPGISAASIVEWLSKQGDKSFVLAPATNNKTEIPSLAGLQRNRETQAQLRDQIATLENAPLSAADMKQTMRAQITAAAEGGQPDISPLAHGGEIAWATRQFLALTHGASPTVVPPPFVMPVHSPSGCTAMRSSPSWTP